MMPLGAHAVDEASDQLAAIDAERLRLLCELYGGGLRAFITRHAPHHAPIPRHLDPIIDIVERARFERIKACVSLPPRHGKTITIQRALAWWIATAPADTCAYASYSQKQAASKWRVVRELLAAEGVAIGAIDTQAEFRTRAGGGLLTVGAGGGLTGQGVQGLMVVDDPYALREEAESPVIREKVWDWFSDVVSTRLEGASVIVVHTRWTEDDLIGRLTREHGWDYLNLAAVCEDPADDPLGRAPGEALWPEAFPLEFLEQQRSLNSYTFASLYQGRPRPRGSSVFRDVHVYDPDEVDLTGARIILIGDPAATEKTSSDPSAIVALAVKGIGDQAVGYVREVYRDRVTVPQYVRDLLAFRSRNGNGRIGVEAVGGFKAVPQMLRDMDPSLSSIVYDVTPVGDKFTRAQPAATAWNQGRIMVPLPKSRVQPPWVKPFVEEVLSFTGVKDRHDDQVDVLSHAWNEAMEKRPPARYIPPSNKGQRRV